MATVQLRAWLTAVAVPLLWSISIVVQPSMTPTRWVQRAVPLAVSIGFMVVLGSTLRPGKPTPLALRNPFDAGSFAVTNGGAGWLVNGHWSVPQQRHAIDDRTHRGLPGRIDVM